MSGFINRALCFAVALVLFGAGSTALLLGADALGHFVRWDAYDGITWKAFRWAIAVAVVVSFWFACSKEAGE